MNEKTLRERVLKMDEDEMKRALLYLAVQLDDGEVPSIINLLAIFE